MKSGYLGVLILIFLLTGCSMEEPVSKVTPCRPPSASRLLKLDDAEVSKMNITTATVQDKDLPIVINLVGHVEADAERSNPITSLVDGKIHSVNVKLGDSVKSGELLATVESDDVAQIESDMLNKALEEDATIKDEEVEMKLSQAVYDRRTLLLNEKIGSQADLDLADHDLLKAQADLNAAKERRAAAVEAGSERLRLFGVEDGEADKVLSTHKINNVLHVHSPRSGVVIRRDANPGQRINNTDSIVTVADLSKVWVIAQVFEQDVKAMRVGLPVDVVLDSYNDRIFKGKIDYISPNIDPETRTLSVRASVDNPQLLMKPQMFGHMKVITGVRHVLAIPNKAIQTVGEAQLAYVVVSPREFNERHVQTGDTIGSFTQVVKGLKSGEKVVVDGSLQLEGESIQRYGE